MWNPFSEEANSDPDDVGAPRKGREHLLPIPVPRRSSITSKSSTSTESSLPSPLSQLFDRTLSDLVTMGFADTPELRALIAKHQGDLSDTMNELLSN
jgi:hypothetical protein